MEGKEHLGDWLLGGNLDPEDADVVEWIRSQAL